MSISELLSFIYAPAFLFDCNLKHVVVACKLQMLGTTRARASCVVVTKQREKVRMGCCVLGT